MKRFLLSSLLMGFISVGAKAQLVQWTFETSIPATAGPHSAEVGTGSASGFHTSGSVVYSNPAGNGSVESYSSNNWTTVGDYYQFQFATTGYNTLSITWDQTSSGTGPRDFKVQYSTDGSSFTDATGTNSTYTITGETWSAGSGNPASTRTLNLSGVAVLQNAPAVYIRLVSTSLINVGGGAIAAAGSSRVDNFTVNANIISSNTITVGLLSSATFNIDCFTDGTATLDFTSSGTFNAGNIYNAELSDAAGSFAAPTVVGSLTSTANTGTINITIPAGTPTGAGYLIRIVSTNPVVTSSNTSVTININLSGACISLATDYFRSKTTGNWNTTTTWQSSTTGIAGSWINATLTPDNNANTISIRNTHTVTITASVSVDQVQIESGGILNHTGGTITVEDGTGDDIDIQSGGIFRLALVSTPPAYGAGTPVINVQGGGILRVSAGGMTGAGVGVNSNNIDYEHQSILEWAPSGVGSFSSGNVTYFPNAAAGVIPIFRSSNTLSMTVGAGSNTVINGVFEANSATVIWESSGTKTFRNGIRGSALIDGQNGTTPSGKFIINGVTAEIGGTGTLVLPSAIPLEVGSTLNTTTVTLSSAKTITGSITLINANNSILELGANNLTVSGTVLPETVGATNSYVRTNGVGVLTLNNITTSKTFPIGNTTYNPLVITTTSGNNFSARVENGIVPPLALPLNSVYAVQRTWNIFANVGTGGVQVTYQYNGADFGASVTSTDNMEILQNSGGVWSVVPGQQGLAQSGADPYTTNTTVGGITIGTASTPYLLGKSGGFVLPIDCIISASAQKRNNSGIISWNVNSCTEVNSFEVQRSVGNGIYQTIGTIVPSNNQVDFNLTDPLLSRGVNLYRIKVNGFSGATKYSNIVALIHESDQLLVTSLVPNPAHALATLTISAAKQSNADFQVYDLSGQLVKKWTADLAEGNNTIEMNVTELPAGVYQVLVSTIYSRTVTRFIKQ